MHSNNLHQEAHDDNTSTHFDCRRPSAPLGARASAAISQLRSAKLFQIFAPVLLFQPRSAKRSAMRREASNAATSQQYHHLNEEKAAIRIISSQTLPRSNQRPVMRCIPARGAMQAKKARRVWKAGVLKTIPRKRRVWKAAVLQR